MKTVIRTLIGLSAASAVSLSGVAAMAQTEAPVGAPATGPAVKSGGAAATLPNSFDTPAARVAPQVPPAETVAPTVSDPAVAAKAEVALKTTIAALQSGTPNYDDMSPTVADKLRQQASGIIPLIKGFGAVQTIVHVGHENGAELFGVIFDNQTTQWILGQAEDGKITALLFRPAPDAPAAAPAATAPAAAKTPEPAATKPAT